MRKIINWNEDWYFSKGEKVQPDFFRNMDACNVAAYMEC